MRYETVSDEKIINHSQISSLKSTIPYSFHKHILRRIFTDGQLSFIVNNKLNGFIKFFLSVIFLSCRSAVMYLIQVF